MSAKAITPLAILSFTADLDSSAIYIGLVLAFERSYKTGRWWFDHAGGFAVWRIKNGPQ
jgi:hypothetical protein